MSKPAIITLGPGIDLSDTCSSIEQTILNELDKSNDWEKISECKALTSEFIKTFSDKLEWNTLIHNYNFNGNNIELIKLAPMNKNEFYNKSFWHDFFFNQRVKSKDLNKIYDFIINTDGLNELINFGRISPFFMVKHKINIFKYIMRNDYFHNKINKFINICILLSNLFIICKMIIKAFLNV